MKQVTVKDLQEDRDRNWGRVQDLGRKHEVIVQWDLNEDAKRDKVFKLIIDDKTVYLSVEELQKLLRWV